MHDHPRGTAFPKSLLPFLLLGLFQLPTLTAKESSTRWALPPYETFLKIIPPPPAPGSAAAQADLDGVLAMQDHPTQQELEHAEKSVGFTVFSFAEVLGPDFTPESYPETARFFKRLEETANAPKNFIKDSYHRDRPYKAFPGQVKELVTEEHGYSYPSGHSTRSWLFALLLGELDPIHRNAFLASAMQVCNDRVMGGMHYPSDMMASRVLAEELYRILLKNTAFMNDLDSLRLKEWSKRTSFR
jgi:acid phosphatase (class A)